MITVTLVSAILGSACSEPPATARSQGALKADASQPTGGLTVSVDFERPTTDTSNPVPALGHWALFGLAAMLLAGGRRIVRRTQPCR